MEIMPPEPKRRRYSEDGNVRRDRRLIDGDGATARDIMDGRGDGIAEADGTAQSAADAREGPGGPRVACATVAVASSSWMGATATVAATSDLTVTLTQENYAREVVTERGETVTGPPSGCVAPLDGEKGGHGYSTARTETPAQHAEETRCGAEQMGT